MASTNLNNIIEELSRDVENISDQLEILIQNAHNNELAYTELRTQMIRANADIVILSKAVVGTDVQDGLRTRIALLDREIVDLRRYHQQIRDDSSQSLKDEKTIRWQVWVAVLASLLAGIFSIVAAIIQGRFSP